MPDAATVRQFELAMIELGREIERAEELHKPYNSHHEAYAVILEELEEYWQEVKKKYRLRRPAEMRGELLQVAATAIRTVAHLLPYENLTRTTKGRDHASANCTTTPRP